MMLLCLYYDIHVCIQLLPFQCCAWISHIKVQRFTSKCFYLHVAKAYTCRTTLACFGLRSQFSVCMYRRGVWHGSVEGQASSRTDCHAWNSNSRMVFGRGFSISNTGRLVKETLSCDSHMTIMCTLTSP